MGTEVLHARLGAGPDQRGIGIKPADDLGSVPPGRPQICTVNISRECDVAQPGQHLRTGLHIAADP